MNQLVMIGAGGHGKVVADIALHCGYRDIVVLDDDGEAKACLGFPVSGDFKDISRYPEADFIVAVGDAARREDLLLRLLKEELQVVTLIHPGAVVAPDVKIGRGTVVMAGAVINPGSSVGDGCIINTGATVDHDNHIEDYVHVSVGSHLAGMVAVGKSTWIGAGAIVSNHISICGSTMVGAGAVVVKDIWKPGVYVGVPAKALGKEMP